MIITMAYLTICFPTSATETPLITIKKINKHVYVLIPEDSLGANVGVVISSHGVLLIDAMDNNEVSTKILDKTLRTITKQPVKFIINTHSHQDHTGANAFYQAKGATIISQENILYANANNSTTLHYSQQWYIDNTLTMTFGNQSIVATTAISHTHNDLIVYLPQTNIVFMGDNFGTNWGPSISEQSAGVLTRVLNKTDDKSIIVPGHGFITNKSHLATYKKNSKIWASTIHSLAQQGLSPNKIMKNKTIKALTNYFNGSEKNEGGVEEKHLIRRLQRTIDNRPIPAFPIKRQHKYVGVYSQKNGEVLEVILQDDFLYARIKGKFITEISPISTTQFNLLGWNNGENIQFSLDNKQEIIGATLIQPKQKKSSQ